MKVIIAGGREFADYELLKKVCNHMLSKTDQSSITVVSGGARGVDKMGESYAKEHGIECIVMNAEWDKYGKSAGYLRNQAMANISTHLIAFWDGKSRGTKHMIDIAKKDGLTICAIDFNGASIGQTVGLT